VVITVDPQNVSALTSGVVILSQKRKVELAFSSSRTSQCKNCWRYNTPINDAPPPTPRAPFVRFSILARLTDARIPPAPGAGTITQSHPVVRPRPPIALTAVVTTLPHSGNVRLDLLRLSPPEPARQPPPQTVKPPWIWRSMATQHPLLPRPGRVPLRWTSYLSGNFLQLDSPRVLALLKASVVLSPWRSQALPLPFLLVGFVPEMNNQPMPPPLGEGPAPPPAFLSIIQDNCLGSWNVFLSLFESFREATTYPSIVLLQDPPVNKAHLPSFNGFKSFFPPVRKLRVAAYVHMTFLSNFTVLPRFTGVDNVIALDISSNEPLFGTAFQSFRIINPYSTNTANHRVHSVSPEVLFPDLGFPLLVLGDLNIHNPLSDPLRHFSHQEISSSTPYFEKAAESGFALLNPPGEYTRFSLVGKARPSVIDRAFANPRLLPLVKSWEASLPSTGSDHVPITITLASPSLYQKPLRPHCADTDWVTLDPIVKGFKVLAAPSCPTPPQLDEWMSESLNRLVALLKVHTPVSRPSHHSKP